MERNQECTDLSTDDERSHPDVGHPGCRYSAHSATLGAVGVDVDTTARTSVNGSTRQHTHTTY